MTFRKINARILCFVLCVTLCSILVLVVQCYQFWRTQQENEHRWQSEYMAVVFVFADRVKNAPAAENITPQQMRSLHNYCTELRSILVLHPCTTGVLCQNHYENLAEDPILKDLERHLYEFVSKLDSGTALDENDIEWFENMRRDIETIGSDLDRVLQLSS